MALTLFLVARTLTIISMMGGLLDSGHFTWRHGAKYVLLAFHLEDVVVRSAIVDDSSIELPGRPRRIWQTVIGTTSHSKVSL